MVQYNETMTGRKTPKLNVEAIMNKPKKEKELSPLRARILAKARANADTFGR